MAANAPRSSLPARSFSLEPYDYSEVRALTRELALAEPVAVTLVRRGYRTVEAARAFLEATESHDPFEFEGMSEVVERLHGAVSARRTITVHGDYDVDGVCSTAILVGAMRELGGQVDWYIPDRLGDGYGLTMAGVELLAARGTQTLVTVDCGITCADEVEAARRAGLEVIVTDHHEPGERAPDCPVLHPVLSGYPCAQLCATGVAYKLAAAILGEERAAPDLDLVALATVADLVPLIGENRGLVRRGLAEARRGQRPGLRALMAVAAIEPERLDEGDLAFRLGPRINAAGRMHRADAGVELMLTADPERAAAIAAELDRANHERRGAEQEMLSAAERARAELPDDLADAPCLVLAGEGWHPGVVGIVASRLAERHWRPAVLIGLNADGRGRGSGRSIPGFDLLAALQACGEHLVRFGGHRAAAGLEIEAGGIDAFRRAFAAHARSILGDEAPPRVEPVDAVVGGESLGLDVAEQLARLGPFGQGNPGVRLLVPAARLRDVRPMGEGDAHARFSLESGARRALGVAFRVNGELDGVGEGGAVDLSVSLEVNHWNGAVEPRVVLGELYVPEGDAPAAAPAHPIPPPAEWQRRLRAELEAPLGQWPPRELVELARAGRRRSVVDRRGCSGAAGVAALASSAEAVLVLCADARRRRGLVESVVIPARFGGGPVALAAGAFSDAALDERIQVLEEAGSGGALADWAALTRRPSLPSRFEHVVVIDPPPFAHLEDLADRSRPEQGGGYLHLAWSDPEVELALQVHEAEWPVRQTLARVYRELTAESAARALSGDDLIRALAGTGPFPRTPEVAARCLRVLGELELVRWAGHAPGEALVVVSSEGKDLERSGAFVAYRDRFEEGRRFLSGRRQAS
jgi:single-stranded-DNA-specific exonuclease